MGPTPDAPDAAADADPTAGRIASALAELADSGCLELPGARLAELPALPPIGQLKEVDLCGNELVAIPAELLPPGQSLKRLALARNRLESLPACLADSQCRRLYLQHNCLTAPPPLPGNLQLVDLSDNALGGTVALPLADGQPMLAAVKVARNRISLLRLEAGPTLGTLDASGNALRALPQGSWLGAGVRKLNLSGNRLSVLAPALTSCVGLVELDLSANALCALPLDLSPLASLKALALQRNRLAALPRSVWLPSLLELNVSRNRLAALPPPRAAAPLVELTAAANELRALPAPLLAALPSLTRLDVSANRLAALDVGGLGALRRLGAACNPLGGLPAGLGALSRLQALSARDCGGEGGGGEGGAGAAAAATLPAALLELELGCAYDLGDEPPPPAAAPAAARTLRALPAAAACGHVRVRAAVAEMCGRRRGMEDRAALLLGAERVVVGVFDGHGGDEVSALAAARLPAAIAAALAPPSAEDDAAAAAADADEAAAALNVSAGVRAAFDDFAAAVGGEEFGYVGTTATVAAVLPGVLLVANVGDSAALLLRGAEREWLSAPQRPGARAEEERICAAGGSVSEDGELNGMLGVARFLGDTALPPPHCHEPAVRAVPLRAGDGGATLVLASDGLWDVVGDAEVAALLREAGGAAEAQAAALRDEAFLRGSADNITVAVLHLAEA